MNGLLKGKNAVVTGLANDHSIAWFIIQAFQAEGANVVATVQTERHKTKAEERLEGCPPLLVMDASFDSSIDECASLAKDIFSRPIDILVHSLAFTERSELQGRYVDGIRGNAVAAFDISAESLRSLSRSFEPYMADRGSVMYLTFAASHMVYPNYNCMAIAKAALETAGTYLASDLGIAKGIRVNGISAGPLRTLSAKAIADGQKIYDIYDLRAPLPKATHEDVANAALFLASDLSQSITGEIIHVDGGFHKIAISRREAESLKEQEAE